MSQVHIPEAFGDLFTSKARIIGYWGGRGSAKSHSVAQALVLKAAQTPLRILCAREIQRSIKDSVKRLLDDKIEESGLGWFYDSTDSEIRGLNGSLFVFAGLRSNIASIKSLEGLDLCWCEEASTVSQDSLNTLIPTVRKPGSQLIFTWNARYATDPIEAMLRGPVQRPDAVVKRINWDDNPWFPDVLRTEMEWDRARDPGKYSHIWLGEYLKNSEAQVFKNWSIEPFETPADARFYFGADWGFSVDPTVLVRCWVKDRTLYIDKEAYRVGCEIDRTPALFDTIEGSRKWPIRADSARPETISYMQRNGFPNITAANKGAGSVEDGVEFLKSYDIKVHPDCKHTIDELSMYSYKTDKLTGEVLPVLEDKCNHCLDAIRYGIELLRKAPPSRSIHIPFMAR